MGGKLPQLVSDLPNSNQTCVPVQGFGMNDLIVGSEAFRGFINKHAGASIAPEGAEKLYISRSTLPRDRGSILGEYKLEEYLRAEAQAHSEMSEAESSRVTRVRRVPKQNASTRLPAFTAACRKSSRARE